MRDAEPAEFPPMSYPRLEPRQPLVWIRIAGTWREGRIIKWVQDGEQWVVWTSYTVGRYSSTHAWLRYDPEAIAPRADDEPSAG